MENTHLSCVLLATFISIGSGSVAFADDRSPSTEVPRVYGQVPALALPSGDGIAANGRCGGVSFGTGARRCGDLTGGPSGGISSRN